MASVETVSVPVVVLLLSLLVTDVASCELLVVGVPVEPLSVVEVGADVAVPDSAVVPALSVAVVLSAVYEAAGWSLVLVVPGLAVDDALGSLVGWLLSVLELESVVGVLVPVVCCPLVSVPVLGSVVGVFGVDPEVVLS